ncbi:MAG: DUF86 domain-containing protein [Acidobacteria bacterium]|nr:DUF86 domain-containing protein [Acidobacteriota bacterium]
MTGRDAACLWDMRNAAETVLEFTKGCTAESFSADAKLRLAVERSIEIIGEAARRLSEDFRAAHPEVPWRQIIAQRNVLIHEYDQIHPDALWRLVSGDLPALVSTLTSLLPPLPGEAPCP